MKGLGGLAARLLAWFLCISLIPLAVVTLLNFRNSQRDLADEVSGRIRALAEGRANQLESFARERRSTTAALARVPTVGQALQQLSGAHPTPLEEETVQLLRDFVHQFGYTDLLLVSANGEQLFSLSGTPKPGTRYDTLAYRDSYIGRAFDGARMFMEIEISDFALAPGGSEPVAYVAAPVLHQGRVLGVLILQMNNTALGEIVNDFNGLGKSGEVLLGSLVDMDVQWLTPTRFDVRSANQRRFPVNEVQGMREAVHGERGYGEVAGTQGEVSLAAWRYLPSLRCGLVVRIPSSEALEPLERERRQVILILSVTLVALVILAILAAGTLTSPLAILTQGAGRIAAGDLNHVVTAHGAKEIQELASAFNSMTADLRRSYAGVEQKVEERTQQLNQQTNLFKLLESVSRTANQAASSQEAMELGLKLVRDLLGWPLGHAWVVAEEELISCGLWDGQQDADFCRVTAELKLKAGQDLPGRALLGNEPVCVGLGDKVSSPLHSQRVNEALQAGLRQGLALPIVLAEKTVAVLEFFTPEAVPLTPNVLQDLAPIGAQLGRVFEREAAQRELVHAKDEAERGQPH